MLLGIIFTLLFLCLFPESGPLFTIRGPPLLPPTQQEARPTPVHYQLSNIQHRCVWFASSIDVPTGPLFSVKFFCPYNPSSHSKYLITPSNGHSLTCLRISSPLSPKGLTKPIQNVRNAFYRLPGPLHLRGPSSLLRCSTCPIWGSFSALEEGLTKSVPLCFLPSSPYKNVPVFSLLRSKKKFKLHKKNQII